MADTQSVVQGGTVKGRIVETLLRGMSAYEIAVKKGYTGTEEEWLASLVGNGIRSAVLNSNYTLTITFTDGTRYTTPSIRGEKGEGLTWNLLVGTGVPDVSSAAKYPHIDGQGANTEVTGIISAAEHGVRITKDEYGGLSIQFGNGDAAFGLEPGTYTLSFDLWIKATTTFYGLLPHLTLTYEAGSQYKDVNTRDLTQAELGNDVNIGTVSITFTVNNYRYPRLSITTLYPDCFANGGYIELRNLMLVEGSEVKTWGPHITDLMPVKGTDYWTAEDRAMIVQDVSDMLGLTVENNLLCAVYDESYEEENNG